MTMKAGTYYIGDLCYVLSDEWNEFCDITIKGDECLDGEFELKDGRKFATYGTAFGDGEYSASNGAVLGVDAGLIGCILLSDIDTSDNGGHVPATVGTIVTFDKDFETGEYNGTITFGHISVYTNYDEYDEDECDE